MSLGEIIDKFEYNETSWIEYIQKWNLKIYL